MTQGTIVKDMILIYSETNKCKETVYGYQKHSTETVQRQKKCYGGKKTWLTFYLFYEIQMPEPF